MLADTRMNWDWALYIRSYRTTWNFILTSCELQVRNYEQQEDFAVRMQVIVKQNKNADVIMIDVAHFNLNGVVNSWAPNCRDIIEGGEMFKSSKMVPRHTLIEIPWKRFDACSLDEWSSHDGPIPCPPPPQIWALIDFFLWGHRKSQVYIHQQWSNWRRQ